MANNLRKCVCCGKEYKYCYSCAEDKNKPLWYRIYDSENCREIFDICSNYPNVLSVHEAKKRLIKIDLTEKDTFKESIKNKINEILASEDVVEIPTVTETVEEIKETKIENTEIVAETVETETIATPSIDKKKTNNKPYNAKGFTKKNNG